MPDISDNYRDEFMARVLSGRPRSILEVGSGAGTFLRMVAGDVHRLVGLDPDDEHNSALQAEGFEMVKGNGEVLPFADGEFDVVVFSFTPHHMTDWAVALNEALRVARHSVEILDVWYDETVADQRTALAFDRWLKQTHRRTGQVHHDSFTPGALLAPVVARRELTYDYVCRRIACASNIEETLATGRKHLAKVDNDAALSAAFDAIIADARRDGMSEEGCIQMTIEKGR